MKLSIWMQIKDFTVTEAAKFFNISHTHIYNYLYLDAIPKRPIMQRIYDRTLGSVTPCDFYDCTDERFKNLLKQKRAINGKNK